MNKLDLDYQKLLQDILNNGIKKTTRNGETLSVFGRHIRHKMSDGFPVLTTKKMYFKGIVTELIWFLRGDTSIKYLVENDCNIWSGDAYKAFQIRNGKCNCSDTSNCKCDDISQSEFIERIKTDDVFAKKWGELGPVYGKQWRNWGGWNETIVSESRDEKGWLRYNEILHPGIDQIQNLINDLKTNPDSRRMMVNAWNPSDLQTQVLPPCHYGFQVYTRELSLEERVNIKGEDWLGEFRYAADSYIEELLDGGNVPKRAISLMYNARSQDVPLGTPFNIASYGLLLEILAKTVNMVPDELIANMGDCHIYINQIDGIKEQLKREPFELPTLQMNPIFLANLDHKGIDEAIMGQINFELENYQSHPTIKMPLSN